MKAITFVHCRDGTVDDVVDVSKVSHHRAVAVNRDGTALFDEFCEFVDSQVRSLAGAVDGEKTQGDYANSVKMMICVADKLTGLFGCGVRRDREIDVVVFRKGDFFIVAVDART